MPRTVKLLPLFVLASLVAMAPASAGDDVPPYRSSDNMELVAHIPGAGGTDLEFFSRDLRVWVDAVGTVHELDEEEPAVTRHFAMVGNQQTGAKIVDITDPEAPFIASAVQNCAVGQGDIQVTRGGTLAAIAWQTSAGQNSCRTHEDVPLVRGSVLVDLADVYDPRVVGNTPEPLGSHNQTIHPSGDYLYISTSGHSPPRIPIWDIRDPANPVLVQKWQPAGGNAPHDIRFSHDGTRAYMAGISNYRIVNTEDPERPSLITSFTPPGTRIGHDVLVTPDKAFLFAGEEMNGGSTAPCPGGPIYAYDIRDETDPVLLGIAQAGSGPVTGRAVDEVFVGGIGGCTSHVMDLNPDARSLSIGWYVSGTRTFDFSGLYDAEGNPRPTETIAWGSLGVGPLRESGWIVPDGGNTWSAKQYAEVPGYVFSDDLVMGFYVTKITS